MASRINSKSFKSAALLLVLLGVFLLLFFKHFELSAASVRSVAFEAIDAGSIAGAHLGIYNPCEEDEAMRVFSPTVYICDEPTDTLVYDDIYNLYPASAEGRESIYQFLERGDKERADEMVEDVYFIQRYEPVTFKPPLTWREDPFGERYWRYIYYSLRPIRHLLATAEETRAERYYDKTREIINSFITNGMDEVHSWDDSHGVSFRTMVLVHAWWKLREAGELPAELSDKILAALEIHGEFLLDPENYEGDHNHAITQSAALLLLAENFPELANAEAWRETAIRRINVGLSSIVDPNGVLIENSPYYHFYALEKYWEIYAYARANDIEISERFDETMTGMINFATYVLRPDQSVPLLGASSPRTLLRSGLYRDMAERNDEFDFVLTSGVSGDRPSKQHVLFPSSGIALMRSGWGEERPFREESHLLFDTGPYRTDHSDYDVMTISLYGAGTPIIRDTGLYTYETKHPFFDYFHGTRGHNTVMVDGLDQPAGSGEALEIKSVPGAAYTAAWHELYPGVRHSRSVALLGIDALLIVDELKAQDDHEYEQLWHLPPEAEVISANQAVIEAVIRTEEGGDVPVRILQMLSGTEVQVDRGEENPQRGWCALQYEEKQPCPEISFSQSGNRVRYITFITYGSAAASSPDYDETTRKAILSAGLRTYEIEIEFPDQGLVDSSFITFDLTTAHENETFFGAVRQWFNRKL